MISGADALIRSLICEGVDLVFGYPGGSIIPVYDKLYDYQDSLKHVLVRHEQGATHAAQGYARVTGRPGVVIVRSEERRVGKECYLSRRSRWSPYH